MDIHKTPELSEELAKRIRLVRRDVGDMLFHFTRSIEPKKVTVSCREGHTLQMDG